MRTNILTL